MAKTTQITLFAFFALICALFTAITGGCRRHEVQGALIEPKSQGETHHRVLEVSPLGNASPLETPQGHVAARSYPLAYRVHLGAKLIGRGETRDGVIFYSVRDFGQRLGFYVHYEHFSQDGGARRNWFEHRFWIGGKRVDVKQSDIVFDGVGRAQLPLDVLAARCGLKIERLDDETWPEGTAIIYP